MNLKELKNKLEQDFGWEDLDCEDNKWFVDHLLKDTIEAIDVIRCCCKFCDYENFEKNQIKLLTKLAEKIGKSQK